MIKKTLFIFTFVLSQLSFAELKLNSSDKIITDDILTSSGAKVLRNNGPYTGHGYILASPINSGDTGLFWKTFEVSVNQGRFEDNSTYLGSNFSFSIDERNLKIYEKFRSIEKRNLELFVFEYYYKSYWNWEIEDNHYFLINIYTIDEFLEKIGGNKIAKGIIAKRPWDGSSGSQTKVGRIVDIERQGLIGDFCEVELNTGGLSGSSGSGEAIIKLAVTEEDVCSWIEKAIAHGKDVEVEMNKDAFEMWQPSSLFVTSIKFKEPNEKDENAKLKLETLTPKQLDKLKEELVNDPKFLESIIKNLNQMKNPKR